MYGDTAAEGKQREVAGWKSWASWKAAESEKWVDSRDSQHCASWHCAQWDDTVSTRANSRDSWSSWQGRPARHHEESDANEGKRYAPSVMASSPRVGRWGPRSFEGRGVQVVQVGLGTNSTFIQNLQGVREEWNPGVHWLLEAVSEARARHISGIAVEPVWEHVEALQEGLDTKMPNVALVCAALGSHDCEGVGIHVLSKERHNELLRQVSDHQREELQRHLEYIRNMSCVSDEHPEFSVQRKWLHDHYGIWVKLDRMRTDMWSWERLCREFNFRGCELLIVDTEGHDAAILRSMIAHCEKQQQWHGIDVWPHVIQFETMNHCDKVEGTGTEWKITSDLESHGYTTVHYSHHNSHVVRTDILHMEGRVQKWASGFRCSLCSCSWKFPYTSDRDVTLYCRPCALSC